ncbi:MAG: response regulator [Oligoflexus sp.]
MFIRRQTRLSRSRFSRKPVLFGVNLGFIIILAVFLVNLANLYENTRLFDQNQQRAEVITRFAFALEEMVSALHIAESSQQIYLVSEDRYHLDRFFEATELTEKAMRNLENFIPDQEPLPPLVLDLLTHAARRLELLRRGVRIMQRDGRAAALDFQADEISQEIRTSFDKSLTAAREPTHTMMNEKVNKVQRDQMMANASFLGAAVLNLLLVLTGFILVRRYISRQEFENWLKSGEAELNSAMSSKQNLADFASSTLGILASYLSSQRGVFYLHHDGQLIKAGSFAAGPISNEPNSIPLRIEDFPRLPLDSSLAGECIKFKNTIHIQEIANSSMHAKNQELVRLGVGEWHPHEIMLFPIFFDGEITAVIELASLGKFSKIHKSFIETIQQDIGRSLDNVIRRSEISSLLMEKTRRTEELQMQQEELRASNEELEEQTHALNDAKKRLQLQQEELEQTNIELEQQARILEEQKNALKLRNEDLVRAKEEIERKAREVELGSRFKSEFLANMSHELRTPLNSVLIMSTLLSENQKQHLSETEVDYAKTINKAGSDLLNLINDILDLSKVEAGQMNVYPEAENLTAIVSGIQKIFQPLADEKQINFIIDIEDGLSPHVITDRQRLEQIINNFLSNAFKFTEQGQITLRIEKTRNHHLISSLTHTDSTEFLTIKVIDTGIGISQEDRQEIFEAFRQVDGSIRRKHGGTGLGLAICKQLASLLQGTITVESEIGQGSKFCLHIPQEMSIKQTADDIVERANHNEATRNAALDLSISDENRVYKFREILIVEDDHAFASTVAKVAEEFRLRSKTIHHGDEAITYLSKNIPEAIVLDINLPGTDGLSLLDSIKQDAELQKIPIHVISGYDYKQKALDLGALSYQLKPVSIEDVREAFSQLEASIAENQKRILLVEDQPEQRQNVIKLLASEFIQIDEACTGQEAIERLGSQSYDCIILDLNLPDFSGFEVLDEIEKGQLNGDQYPPIIIFTAKDLSSQEQERLKGRFSNVIVKGGRSSERLLDEVELFLHQIGERGGSQKSKVPARTSDKHLENDERLFADRRVMVVDDDLRNVFALASVLENKDMTVTIARNGQEALEVLEDPTSQIEIVLMDIMMPVMDGFTAIKKIRETKEHKNIPIIALTAKAMKGDRERCLEAGATDYLAKPIELSQLFSLLRVWLSQVHTKGFIHSERR